MKTQAIITPFVANGTTICYYEQYMNGKYQKRTARVMGDIAPKAMNKGHLATIISDGKQSIASDIKLAKYSEMMDRGIVIENVVENTGFSQFKSLPNITACYNEESFVIGKGGNVILDGSQYRLNPVKILVELPIQEAGSLFEITGEFDKRQIHIMESLIQKNMRFMSMTFQRVIAKEFEELLIRAAKELNIYLPEMEEEVVKVRKL